MNEKGREQVKSLSTTLSALPLAAIYTSPLERTVETADAISRPHGLTPIKLNALLEVDFGEWTGQPFSHLDSLDSWRSFNLARSVRRPPGGELMLETQSRMVAQMGELVARHPDEQLVIVSHADPIRTVISHCLGSPIDLLPRFNINPASISALGITNGLPTILYINRTDAILG